jgi:hypothetical protein
VVEVGPIGEEDLPHDPFIPVHGMRLDGDGTPEHQCGGRELRHLPERLALLRAINAIQSNPFSLSVVEDINTVSVENTDDITSEGRGRAEDGEEYDSEARVGDS